MLDDKKLINYLTISDRLRKDEAKQLFDTFKPYIEQVNWDEDYKEHTFAHDLYNAYKKNLTPEQWLEQCQSSEKFLANPNPSSDFMRLKTLLTDFGVAFTVKRHAPSTGFSIALEAYTEKVVGYAGFQSDYSFDHNGVFVEIGIFE